MMCNLHVFYKRKVWPMLWDPVTDHLHLFTHVDAAATNSLLKYLKNCSTMNQKISCILQNKQTLHSVVRY